MSTAIKPVAGVTVTARLTPAIPSAIATIAVHGPLAVEIVGRLVKCKQTSQAAFPLGLVRYGLWNAAEGDDAAEQVVVCRTQSQTIEIHCHGGNAVCQMILGNLVTAGCRSIPAADFPIDTDCEFKREAAIDLQKAVTDRAAAILLDQLNGALGNAIEGIVDRFRIHGGAAVRSDVEELLRWSDLGLHLVEPWKVVLAGPPNAGKSSLMNAIVGHARAIVHSEPGTTRDWVETLTAIDGWPISLTDTAGLRESYDLIESEGIRRARERIASADMVIFVVDATVGWTDTHEKLKSATDDKRSLTVWNKIDLSEAMECPVEAIRTCASERHGIAELLAVISTKLVPAIPPPSAAVPFRLRHVRKLESLIS
jgi:tRNA modification GTPase